MAMELSKDQAAKTQPTGPTDEELAEATVQHVAFDDPNVTKFWAGPGWYAWYADYPEEGSWHFDHEPTNAELQKLGLARLTPENLRAAGDALQARIGVDGSATVGLGQLQLYVYVHDKARGPQLPEYFRGFPVEPRYTGKVRPA